MDAGITEGRALGWTDHGVSKFGLQRQVLNTKANSACFSSLAFIPSPQVTAPQVLRRWETFHKDMFSQSFISILESLAVLMLGCLQSTKLSLRSICYTGGEGGEERRGNDQSR